LHLSEFLTISFQEIIYSFSSSKSTKEDNVTHDYTSISLSETKEEIGEIHIKTTSNELVTTIYSSLHISEEKKCTIFLEIKTSIEKWFSSDSIHRIRLLQQTHSLNISVLPFNERLFYIPIEYLELSPRSHNCLMREGYTTVGQLSHLTKTQLGSIHQLGYRSIQEIIEKLDEVGITIS
jgi:hypothetical protein